MPTATAPLTARYAEELDAIRSQGLFKSERIVTSPQSAEITLEDGRTVLNFCANNYLGLADHPAMIEAARAAIRSEGSRVGKECVSQGRSRWWRYHKTKT